MFEGVRLGMLIFLCAEAMLLAWVEGIPVPCEAQEAFAAPERSRQLLARELVVLPGALPER